MEWAAEDDVEMFYFASFDEDGKCLEKLVKVTLVPTGDCGMKTKSLSTQICYE